MMTNPQINALHCHWLFNDEYAHQVFTYHLKEKVDADTCINMALAYSYNPLDMPES